MAGETFLQHREALRTIPERWGSPDPKYLSQLPRKTRDGKTIQLDYMDHAQIRAALTAEDPEWQWAPMALDEDGLPKVKVVNGQANLWIYLTVHGKSQPGCGNALTDKQDILKELIGDALRNGAMTFGFGLSLWTKNEALATAPANQGAEPPQPDSLPTEGPQLAEQTPQGRDTAERGSDAVDSYRASLVRRANSLPPGDRGTFRASVDLQGLSWQSDSDLANIELLLAAAEAPLPEQANG
jgi:hypothetical protein